MLRRRILRLTFICVICCALPEVSGTTTPEQATAEAIFLRRIDRISRKSLTQSARVNFLKQRPHLAFDSASAAELRHWIAEKPEQLDRERLAEFVARAAQLAHDKRRTALAGLAHQQHEQLLAVLETGGARDAAEQYAAVAGSEHEALDRRIVERIQARSAGAETALLARELDCIRNLSAPAAVLRYAEQLLRAQRPSIKQRGRLTRLALGAPLYPVYFAWRGYHALTEDRGPRAIDFEASIVYEPAAARDNAILARLASATDEELLALFTPRIVQQQSHYSTHEPGLDVPGELRAGLDGEDEPAIYLAPERPAIYGHTSRALIDGMYVKQLVYTFWYGAHAANGAFDPEAGPLEGLTLRVTLDESNQPLVYESMNACGCYHLIFPDEHLLAAHRASTERLQEDVSALAVKVPFKIDAVIPESAGEFDPADPHPTVWVYAGQHTIGKVANGAPAEFRSGGLKQERRALALHPYAELEALPFAGRAASIFDGNGLVRNADRAEAWLLFPSGIYHAGTPRQRGTHLIHFDQYDFDDPTLLGQLLHWPSATQFALAERLHEACRQALSTTRLNPAN